jgi:predicted DNA-binding transcriptional regulator AlpA
MNRRPSSHTGQPANAALRPAQGSLRRPLPTADDAATSAPPDPRQPPHTPLSPADPSPTRGTAMTDRRRGAAPGFRKHLTIADVCNELDVARSTFYDWRAKGRAPRCIKLPNGELRIRRGDLDAWLDSCTEEAA